MPKLQAFRLIGGPCHGEIAEMPVDGFDEFWRCVHETDEHEYAEYKRDGAVFRFAGRRMSAAALAEHCAQDDAEATVHSDSRVYER